MSEGIKEESNLIDSQNSDLENDVIKNQDDEEGNNDDDPNFRSHENDQKNLGSLSGAMMDQVDAVIQKLVAYTKKKKERELDSELGGTEVEYDKKKASKKTGADINYEQEKSAKDAWDSRAADLVGQANEEGEMPENTQNRSFQFQKKHARLKAKKEAKKKAHQIDKEENAMMSYVEALKQQRQDVASQKSNNSGGMSF